MKIRAFRRLPVAMLFLAALIGGSGCHKKTARELAEERALQRHEREVGQRRGFEQALQQAGMARMFQGAQFLMAQLRRGHLPGLSGDSHGTLELNEVPVVAAHGPYFFTEQLQIVTRDSPPAYFHYVVVQSYSNGDFQLQKAWRTDGSGKILEQYVIPAPAPALRGRIFLGPANPGAEDGMARWYSGVLGSGVVAVDDENPARGFSCFQIGITNADSTRTNHADFRSEPFPLGLAATKGLPVTFSFDYKLPGKVKPGDNIEVYFRFFDHAGTHVLEQKAVLLGSKSGDSQMDDYKTETVRISPPRGAATADIWVAANIFSPWTSGVAQFDDFSATISSGRSWPGFLGLSAAALCGAIVAGGLWKILGRNRRRRVAGVQAQSAGVEH